MLELVVQATGSKQGQAVMADLDSEQRKGVTRRRFIGEVLTTACGVGLLGLGLGLYSTRASSLPAHYLRPPGALPEDEFNGACIRCGLCVRDCPFDMLFLGRLGEDIPTGTPYFIARQAGCEMCDHIPCVVACPTNALSHELTDIREARMGLAVLIDQESCIAFHGLRCEVCFQICPIRGEAISLEYQHNPRSGKHALFIPVVHSDQCTGCGKCEEACILEEAAIKVLPTHLAKGEIGRHYRLGWEQKERAGGALVSPDQEHRYHLPEGLRYEHGGRGLIQEPIPEPPEAAPIPDNPLDSLNRRGPL
jgi:ferredoxin-type protein NapG